MKCKTKDGEYTKDLCQNVLLQAEEDEANWSHRASTTYRQQWKQRGVMEVRRAMDHFTFEVSVRMVNSEEIDDKDSGYLGSWGISSF